MKKYLENLAKALLEQTIAKLDAIEQKVIDINPAIFYVGLIAVQGCTTAGR